MMKHEMPILTADNTAYLLSELLKDLRRHALGLSEELLSGHLPRCYKYVNDINQKMASITYLLNSSNENKQKFFKLNNEISLLKNDISLMQRGIGISEVIKND